MEHNPEEHRLRVLFLPSCYPSKKHPLEGIFIREHARAVALYADVTVIYPLESRPPGHRPARVSVILDGGLRTIRVRSRRPAGSRHGSGR